MKKAISGILVCMSLLFMCAFAFVGCVDNEPNFTDDLVMVLLTNEASLQAILDLKTYTIEDFPEIELREVKNLSDYTDELVRQQLQGTLDSGRTPININNYRSIYYLYLLNPSHQTVLDYIETLKTMPNVYSAEPNYIGGEPAA